MATILFNTLNCNVNTDVKNINFNNQNIEVKQYLPIAEKLDLIDWIITQSADDLKFYNVGKLQVFKFLGLVQHYTNIVFTDEELQDPATLFDVLYSSPLMDEILDAIPDYEHDFINSTLQDTVESIYKYQNSVMGILDTVTTDYQNLNFDVAQLQQNISNPDNLTLLKDVVTKLG